MRLTWSRAGAAWGAVGGLAGGGEAGRGLGGVAPALERRAALDLLPLESGVDLEDLEGPLVLQLVAVDADDDPLAAFDLLLVPERRVRDLSLREVLLDRLDHPAELVDPVE